MDKDTGAVGSRGDMQRRIAAALCGVIDGTRVSFTNVDLFTRVMTAKRWAIVCAMVGASPLSVREVAHRVGRRVQSMNGDVAVLLNCGVIDNDEVGRIVFPFDAVHVDVMVEAA